MSFDLMSELKKKAQNNPAVATVRDAQYPSTFEGRVKLVENNQLDFEQQIVAQINELTKMVQDLQASCKCSNNSKSKTTTASESKKETKAADKVSKNAVENPSTEEKVSDQTKETKDAKQKSE